MERIRNQKTCSISCLPEFSKQIHAQNQKKKQKNI